MDACSCTEPETTGCPNCRGLQFRHRAVCDKKGKTRDSLVSHALSFGASNPLAVTTLLFQSVKGARSRSLRSSKKSKKYQRPKRFSSLRPTLRASVNWSFINKWIREYEQGHSERCRGASVTRPLGRPARVIDVIQGCVVGLGPVDDYITLSYVWGLATLAKGMPTATTSNISSLEQPGSLARQDLPRTIRDAMEVCRRIGRRYLWVDAFCIIQDDPRDARAQIALMCDIYSGSLLTIIAAWGDNADAGLPDVSSETPREPQHVARFDGLEMVEVLPLLGDVRLQSTWMSRAWTSTSNAQSHLRNEDAWVMKTAGNNSPPQELDDHRRLPSSPTAPPRPSPPWPRFRDLLVDYTRRSLSYNNDIFNACTGLYQHVYGPTSQGNRLIFGLPESDFHDALRWESYRYTARAPEDDNVIIPSWSWASRNAKIFWKSRGYTRKQFANPKSDNDASDDDVSVDDTLNGNALTGNAFNEEVLDGNGKDVVNEDGFDYEASDGDLCDPLLVPLVKFEVCLEAHNGWTTIQSSCEDDDKTAAAVEFPAPISHHLPISGRLRFRTQSALFELYGEIGFFQVEHGKQEISLDIRHCGGDAESSKINVSLDWAVRQGRPSCLRSCWHRKQRRRARPSTAREMADEMYPDGWNRCYYVVKERFFKLVLVSAVNLPRHWTVSTLERYIEGGDLKVKDEVDALVKGIPKKAYSDFMFEDLHVMLVDERKDGDAAQRIGVAGMNLRAWLESRPVMEDIVLE
ncbi:heterokaryon incompatibility protein-domain-containing protein [Corynascus similis CBS 632.67]